MSTALTASDVSSEELDYVIDSDLRVVTIPDRGEILGVEGDKDVNSLYFQMNKIYKDVDFSTTDFKIRINYENANGDLDYYTVTNKTVSGDYITFTWVASQLATAYRGTTYFIVRVYSTDSSGNILKAFDTTLSSLTVKEGLDVDSATSEEDYVDLISHIEAEITEYADNLLGSLAFYTTGSEVYSAELLMENEGRIKLFPELEMGYMNSSTGENSTANPTTRARTVGYIPASEIDGVYIYDENSVFHVYAYYYNSDHVYLGYNTTTGETRGRGNVNSTLGVTTYFQTKKSDDIAYIRYCIYVDDGREFTLSEVKNAVTFYKCSNSFSEISEDTENLFYFTKYYNNNVTVTADDYEYSFSGPSTICLNGTVSGTGLGLAIMGSTVTTTAAERQHQKQLPAGTYTYVNSASDDNLYINYYDENDTVVDWKTGETVTFDNAVHIYLKIMAATYDNATYSFFIEKGESIGRYIDGGKTAVDDVARYDINTAKKIVNINLSGTDTTDLDADVSNNDVVSAIVSGNYVTVTYNKRLYILGWYNYNESSGYCLAHFYSIDPAGIYHIYRSATGAYTAYTELTETFNSYPLMAIYESTTYSEIEKAYNAGRMVFLKNDSIGRVLSLVTHSGDQFTFTCTLETGVTVFYTITKSVVSTVYNSDGLFEEVTTNDVWTIGTKS